jgi:hypothetical protein
MRPLSMWMSVYGQQGEAAPPARSIPAGATPTHPPHAAARSPGCGQASPDRHRRCTAPNAFSSSTRTLIEPLIGVRWRLLCPKPQLLREQTAHLLAAHQVVGALVVAGDAVEGEPCPPSASPVRWCSDLGHVFAQDPADTGPNGIALHSVGLSRHGVDTPGALARAAAPAPCPPAPSSPSPSFLAAFLSSQSRAEPIQRPEQAADAEYRYRVQLVTSTKPHLQVQCWRRIPGGGSWNPRCGPMPLANFIQRFLPGDQL